MGMSMDSGRQMGNKRIPDDHYFQRRNHLRCTYRPEFTTEVRVSIFIQISQTMQLLHNIL